MVEVKRTRLIVAHANGKETVCLLCLLKLLLALNRRPKRQMVQKITTAIDEAYHIGDTLIFLREYPAENVAMDGRLQSENPKIMEALKKISA